MSDNNTPKNEWTHSQWGAFYKQMHDEGKQQCDWCGKWILETEMLARTLIQQEITVCNEHGNDEKYNVPDLEIYVCKECVNKANEELKIDYELRWNGLKKEIQDEIIFLNEELNKPEAKLLRASSNASFKEKIEALQAVLRTMKHIEEK